MAYDFKADVCRRDERDYLLSEFPLAFHLLKEAGFAAYEANRLGRLDKKAIDDLANAAAEYGALRCMVRLLRVDPDRLMESFIADDVECDPEEDDSDRYLKY